MHAHFAYDHQARDAVEPVLRASEDLTFLGGRRIRFDFQGADVIDRNPPPGEIGASMSDSIAVAVAIVGATERHEIGCYPPPPKAFAVDPHVEALMILQGSETLIRAFLGVR